jgi:cellulose synthase operon protein C
MTKPANDALAAVPQAPAHSGDARRAAPSTGRPAARRAASPAGRLAPAARLLATAACVLSLASGCAFSSAQPLPPRPQPPAGPVEPSPVSDEGFAQAVHTLLVDGRPSAERQSLLAGVVKRQLEHASVRLKARQRERGLASVLGALYLVRAGEMRSEMIDSSGEQALAMALDIVGATGDEGRSQALYNLRKGSIPAGSPAAEDIDEHLRALGRWVAEQESKPDVGPAEAAGAEERRAVGRSLLEPDNDALKAATQATARWVDAGLVFQAQYQANPRAPRKREEAVEAFRAASSGAATIVALYLRHGDAAGAVEAISGTAIQQVTPSGLLPRLAKAARPGDAAPWRELLELFMHSEGKDPETSIDPSLVQAATFGIAVEAHRRDPGGVDVAMHLATALAAYGMAEAAPTVLAEAAKKHPDAPVLSAMLEAVAGSMAREEASDDPMSARRILAAAAPLLEVADTPALRGKVHPSAPRVRYVAASIEARAGELSSARQLLVAAVRDEPSAEASRLLADVDRQLGNPKGALEHLRAVLASTEARKDRLVEAEARLATSDVERELGERDKAREAALAALAVALDARKLAQPGPGSVRIERLVAKILDRLGDDAGAARATERAFAAAKGDTRQLAITTLEAIARAYVARDVRAARAAAQHAFGTSMRDDELVYIGMWLQLLERELGVRTDGTAARLLGSVEQGVSWSGRLAAWSSGKLSDAELVASARTPGQRTEASFYRALAQRGAGQAGAAETGLREVAKSQALDLMEAQIARDILAGSDRRLPGPPPAGVPLGKHPLPRGTP